MSYSFNNTQKAYCRVIAEHDIYVYIYDTLAHYLLNGYFGLTEIPYNDEDDVEVLDGDDGRPSDISLPSNDPIVTDSCAFRSTHRCGSSAKSTSIKTYMQTTTSLVAVDGRLTKI